MSLYTLNPIKEGNKVDVGYDPWIDSYFLQLRVPDGRNHKLAKWLGHGIGGCSVTDGSIESIPEKVLEAAARYAEIPTGLLEDLIADRHTDPQIVPSTPVMYAGWPNGEVWRHRPSTDPVEGVQIVVKPAKHFIRERHIAFAILKDFLGNEYRARRLSPGFGMLVVRDLPEKRWLLTEVDIQNGIRAVEAQCSLCWLEEGECYAGDCKTEKLDPAEQRKRADWAGKHLNRAEQSDSALVAA